MSFEYYVLVLFEENRIVTWERKATHHFALEEADACNRSQTVGRYFVVHQSELHLYGLNSEGLPVQE